MFIILLRCSLISWASAQEFYVISFPPYSSKFPLVLLLWRYSMDLFSSIFVQSTKVCFCCCLWGSLYIFETYFLKPHTKDHFFFLAEYYNWPSLRRSCFPVQLKNDWKVVGLQNSGRWWHTANKQGLVLSCQSEGFKAFEQRISILPPAGVQALKVKILWDSIFKVEELEVISPKHCI